MSEKIDFKKAMSLLMKGRGKEASTVLLPLYQQTTKKGFKLQLIDALLTALDPLQENQKLIDMAFEGIRLANELRASDLQAHFMAKKADFLMNNVLLDQHQRAN